MKGQLINSMVSFVLGTGASLVALATWTGTTDLFEIKQAVQQHMSESEQSVSYFAEEYKVVVDQANAEIGDYQKALEQANDNISQLITAYEEQQAESEQDLSDLQAELDKMQQRLDEQYVTDMNAIIEQANEQINYANEEVAETKEQVLSDIATSQVDNILNEARQYGQVDITGDKSVIDISSIVPQE